MSIFEKTINSLYERLGSDILIKSNSTGVETKAKAVVKAPDVISEFGETKVISNSILMEIRISEAPNLSKLDEITYNGRVFTLKSPPKKDIYNLIWQLELY